MTQNTAKPHALNTEDERPVRAEGEDGKQELIVKDRQLQLLESIDSNLKKLVFLIESNL